MGMKKQTSKQDLHLYSGINQSITANLMRYQGVTHVTLTRRDEHP